MMERLALWRGTFYEGDSRNVRAIHPAPVISQAACDFVSIIGIDELIFREDAFDPATRIRRGRLYVGGRAAHTWDQVTVDGINTYNWNNLRPEVSYVAWGANANPRDILGHVLQIGGGDFATNWHIVAVERLSIGQILLTLRAHSLFGVLPDLRANLPDEQGNPLLQNKQSQVKSSMGRLVDTFHRFQPVPTVDAARETARVILAAWIGNEADEKDLQKVITLIPKDRSVLTNAAFIVNRLHPRGKSSEQETQAGKGNFLRAPTEEDAETSVHLVGMMLREIGWAAA